MGTKQELTAAPTPGKRAAEPAQTEASFSCSMKSRRRFSDEMLRSSRTGEERTTGRT
jgi:hypothetical protein